MWLKGRERAGLDAEDLAHLLGSGESYASARTDSRVQGLEFERAIFVHDDQKLPSLLILEQRVLGDLAGRGATERLAFLDGAMGKVGDRSRLDAERL